MLAEPHFDFREIAAELDRRGVRYLLFGGQAVRAYGSTRFTADYDLWFAPEHKADVLTFFEDLDYEISEDVTTWKPIVRVFAGTRDRVDAWFVRGMSNRDGVRLDFDELYARGQVIEDPVSSVRLRVPSIDDLIALKRMGEQVRPRDEEDIRFLLVVREAAGSEQT